jgi:hypothetical protein
MNICVVLAILFSGFTAKLLSTNQKVSLVQHIRSVLEYGIFIKYKYGDEICILIALNFGCTLHIKARILYFHVTLIFSFCYASQSSYKLKYNIERKTYFTLFTQNNVVWSSCG